MLLRDSGRTAQEALQVPISVRHIHSSTTEHVGGAHYAGVPNSLAELASRLRRHKFSGDGHTHSFINSQPPASCQAPAYLEVTELSPLRLTDTDGIEEPGELESVLS